MKRMRERARRSSQLAPRAKQGPPISHRRRVPQSVGLALSRKPAHPLGPRFLKQLGRGRRTATGGTTAKLSQAIGNALALGLLVAVPAQGEAEDLSMFRLCGAPMLGCPHAQPANKVLIQIANRKSSHDAHS